MATLETDHFLQVSDFRTHYQRAGNGPPLILIHGLGGSLRWWRPNIGAMAAIRTVYAVDLPGHGLSDKPPISYGLPLARSFLLNFMATTGLASADLMGHSAGGLIALDFALSYPDRVGKLVLVDSAGLGRSVAAFLKLMTLPVVGELLARPRRIFLRGLLRRLFYDRSLATPELLEELRQERSAPGFRQALLSALRSGVDIGGMKTRFSMAAKAPQLKAPTLILWGEEDRILPVSHARAAAQLLRGSRLHIFPRCGHAPNLERPEEFNQIVTDFLKT